MEQWEYCTSTMIPLPSNSSGGSHSDHLDEMTKLGAEGWEHYETIKGEYQHRGIPTGQTYIFYFKRKKQA